MIDIVREIEAVQREVGEGPSPPAIGRFVRLQRDYDAPIEDVWDALTNPERIGRWFLPISGDYRLGGRYQFEGNAGGEILACERPHRLKATWVYGETTGDLDASVVEVRLSTVDGGATRLSSSTPRSCPTNVGGVRAGRRRRGLGQRAARAHRSISAADQGRRSDRLADVGRGARVLHDEQRGVGRANRAAGADPETAARGVANTTVFYAPDPDAAS